MPLPAAPHSKPYWSDIARAITAATHATFTMERRSAAAGGCINTASMIEGSGRRYFVKTNDASRATMFEAEAAALSELLSARAVRVPEPICHGANSQASWIVLEHIELAHRSPSTDAILGAQLAQLHRHTTDIYGWTRDDTIGSTPQCNLPSPDWPAFWRDQRLRTQLNLARENGYGGRLQGEGQRLLELVPAFFVSYTPQPSLLHGDLWSGNAAADEKGAPVIFDPALYYGDREADIAMTELFGGYSPSFYDAYGAAYPLDAGYTVRKNLYNLYHVLNHLNLFGGGYLRQAEQMIDDLLARSLKAAALS
jgi:protein-ribulosamine 3-kinase